MLSPLTRKSGRSSRSNGHEKTNATRFQPRPISIEELRKLELATFREGVNHRRWPREIIAQFLAAEV